MLVVTHEMHFAEEIADRVVFMDHGAILVDAQFKTFFHGPQRKRPAQYLTRVIGRRAAE